MPPLSSEEKEAIQNEMAEESADLDGYFSDAELEPEPDYPVLNNSLDDTCVVILNVPVAPVEKIERLTRAVTKYAARVAALASTEDFGGVHLPVIDGQTAGYALLSYSTPADAARAVETLDGIPFSKTSTFKAHLYGKVRPLLEADSLPEFTPPSMPEFAEKPALTAWLEDPHQRDAFCIRHGSETEVMWFDGGQRPPVVDYDGHREKAQNVSWCESYCFWSPAGSYLATLVPSKGVILWSGPEYSKTARLKAPGVRHVAFSPQENFILTTTNHPTAPDAVQIYHIPTGQLQRVFSLYPAGTDMEEEDEEDRPPPPPFLWSHDDQYICRRGPDRLSIYETSTFQLLDNRSIDTPGIADAAWCPVRNILAYWCPETNNSPAHVDVLAVPSRQKLRQKNLFHVTACGLVWAEHYLAVKVTRHTKSKKTFYNNIELFRFTDLDASNKIDKKAATVPVEMLEIKDAVLYIDWEPTGSRFAMIHAENPHATKVSVSIYDMLKRPTTETAVVPTGKKKSAVNPNQRIPELNKVITLEGKQCNSLFWSPAGTTLLMASLGDSASGTLEFYNVDTGNLVVKEHYRANEVRWDPSGRTVATCVTQPLGGGHFKFAMDNGYVLWSWQGRQLHLQNFEFFYQFLWRPRESLLTKSQIKKIRRNWQTYEEKFDAQDRQRERARYLAETAGKRAARAEVRRLRRRNAARLHERRAEHVQLLGGYDSDDDANYVVTDWTVEKILSSKEEVVV